MINIPSLWEILISSVFLLYLIDYAVTVFPLHSTPPCISPPSHVPPLFFMSMGHTYMFFGFCIFCTILTLPLSIFYLPFMLLTLCIFPPLSPSPVDNPPCELHFCGFVPVLVVCLVCFCFCFRCGC